MTRVQRFTELRNRGLSYNEALAFSRTETKGIEYFQVYIRERRKVTHEWQKWTKRYPDISPSRQRFRYHKMIRDWYARNGWLRVDGKIDPWAAWRHYEKKWKDSPRGDGYIKPAKKKTRLISQTQRKLERSLGF